MTPWSSSHMGISLVHAAQYEMLDSFDLPRIYGFSLFWRLRGDRLCSAAHNAVGLAGVSPVVGIDWVPT